jgi:hypothetical protein
MFDAALDELGDASALTRGQHHIELERWLNQAERQRACRDAKESRVFAPSVEQVIACSCRLYSGDESDEDVLSHIHETAKRGLRGVRIFWGSWPTFDLAAEIRSTTGRAAVLGFEYSLVGDSVLHGVFLSREDFVYWLAQHGRMVRIEMLEKLPRTELLNRWRTRYGDAPLRGAE